MTDLMNEDDVVLLLARAAALAPDRLAREPVAQVARRRDRRRRLAGVACLAVVATGAYATPGAIGQRQVLQPAGEPDVGTEFFDLVLPVNRPDGGRWSSCLDLPGADMIAGPASLSPRATVSAVGTAAERSAVQKCLQDAASVTATSWPDLRAVRVTAATDSQGPLTVSITDVYPEFPSSLLVHDLTVANTADEVVYVDDPSFGDLLPSGLFVGIGCSPAVVDGAVVDGCLGGYSPFTLRPGETRTFQVRLGSGRAQGDPLPEGAHRAEVDFSHQTTAPFGGRKDPEGAQTRVELAYSVTGPSEPVDPPRAAFRQVPRGPDGDASFHLALGGGVLGGDPATGCLWLGGADGTRTPLLVLSDTAEADFDTRPFRLVDGDSVLAVEGQQVSLGGGFGLERQTPLVPGCPVAGTPFTGYFQDDT